MPSCARSIRVARHLLPLALLVVSAGSSAVAGPLAYPKAPRRTVRRTVGGVSYRDQYVPLENRNSEKTLAWEKAEQDLTEGFLAGIPHIARFEGRLREVFSTESTQRVAKVGDRIYYKKFGGLRDQPVIYRRNLKGGAPRVVLDPKEFAADGSVSVTDVQISPDGRHLAYGLSASGSDRVLWQVRDTETLRDSVLDSISDMKLDSVEWAPDSSGFYYHRFPEPRPGEALTEITMEPMAELFFHALGRPQYEDRVVHTPTSADEWGRVVGGGRLLFVEGDNLVRDLTTPGEAFEKIFDEPDAELERADAETGTFWFRVQSEKVPKGKLVRVTRRADQTFLQEDILPEDEDVFVKSYPVGDRIVATYMHDAAHTLRLVDPATGQTKPIRMPKERGSVDWVAPGKDENEIVFSFSAYTVPPSIYRYNVETGQLKLARRQRVAVDWRKFESKLVFVTNPKDGTRVPATVISMKGVKPNGENQPFLYGYGGFGVSLTPHFDKRMFPWLEAGHVYVVANLRGGGEYGDAWHQAGTGDHKQNVFDDYYSVARWLIDEGYGEKVVAVGESNGGLLVGAAITEDQRDLFQLTVPEVGVQNMPRFDHWTVGPGWRGDYGDPRREHDLQTILAYAPVTNVKKGTSYPFTIGITGDHDDRVVPSHTTKFIAELQDAQPEDAWPILLWIRKNTGHGAGLPLSTLIRETAIKFGAAMYAYEEEARRLAQAQ
jgi:prolyl oligopeptidase